MIIFPNGIGGSTGDRMVSNRPFYAYGSVIYVLSTIGIDAGGAAGRNREEPLATLAQAHTNASAGDTIVLLGGHSELLTATLTINKNVVIVAEGSAAGIPTVTFQMNAAATVMFFITADDVELRNIKFLTNAQTNNQPRVSLSGAERFRIRGCYFECGANDTGNAVSIGAACNGGRFENCTFISTATLRTAQPAAAITNTGAIVRLDMEGCTISDGTVGFSSSYAVDFSANPIDYLRVEELSLLLGAEIQAEAAVSYFFAGITSTGGAKITAL